MELLDGRKYSKEILWNISREVRDRVKSGEKPPRLDMILVGDDFASVRYVQIKEQAAKKAGFDGVVHRFRSNVSQEELLDKIDELNSYPPVTGFMVQLPLPSGIDRAEVLNKIRPEKDVDGLSAVNLGLLYLGDEAAIAPATPYGVMLLLEKYGIELKGKHVAMIGNTQIVGLPMVAMLNSKWATVTLCHEETRGLKEICRSADVIVSAVGKKAGLITGDYVKEGAVVVDVGIVREKGKGLFSGRSGKSKNRDKIVGDVDFESVSRRAGFITPVPGGVGPMTIAALMMNTVRAWRRG